MRRVQLQIVGILLFLVSCSSVSNEESKEVPKDSGYSILVAGHAYGDPNGSEKTIYPPLRKFLNENYSSLDYLVLAGDVVRKPEKENWELLLSDLEKIDVPYLIAPGNHDMGDRDLFYSYFGDIEKITYVGKDALLTLDNTQNGWAIDEQQMKLIEDGLKIKGRLFIFVHNVWWHDFDPSSDMNGCYTPNSLAGKAPDSMQNFKKEVLPFLLESKKEVYVVAGDVGATQSSFGASIWKEETVTLLASGMGNGRSDNVLKFDVYDDSVGFEFISLDSIPVYPCQN